MNLQNRTAIRIGMSGTFVGIHYTVVGRVVMGMQEDGQTYFWDEFNLVNERGQNATLVFEETGSGPEWRLFTLFEPQHPMTAAEAATKKINGKVNFDGTPLRVTLVDESRVYFIEGQAPEGVELGDVAHYFNAEGDNKMFVASWTGDEIEFYRGMDLPRGAVKKAFGLSELVSSSYIAPQIEGPSSPSLDLPAKLALLFFAGVIGFGLYASCRSPRQAAGPLKTTLSAPALVVGRNGKLDGKVLRVASHADVEIGQVGRVYERHEYELAGEGDDPALLVYGFEPGEKDWFLFTPNQSQPSISPQEAASYRVGDIIRSNGEQIKVTELWQERVLKSEGTPVSNATTFYGFTADASGTPVLARWTERGILFYRGKKIAEKELRQSFAF